MRQYSGWLRKFLDCAADLLIVEMCVWIMQQWVEGRVMWLVHQPFFKVMEGVDGLCSNICYTVQYVHRMIDNR